MSSGSRVRALAAGASLGPRRRRAPQSIRFDKASVDWVKHNSTLGGTGIKPAATPPAKAMLVDQDARKRVHRRLPSRWQGVKVASPSICQRREHWVRGIIVCLGSENALCDARVDT